jgi:hypothetical protein
MMRELRQPLPLDTPKGPAYAYFLIDRGTDSHLEWVCFIKETGECWTFQNPMVRLAANFTMGIRQGATRLRPVPSTEVAA